jgi:hypothetical protein
MDKNKRNGMILAALAVAAVLVWVRGLMTPVGTGGQHSSESGSTRIHEGLTPGLQSQQQPVAARSRTRYTDWKRNPFMLSGELDPELGDLVLDGILWDADAPLVMMNDEVLMVGDRIEGRVITRITQTEVTLEKNGKEFILKPGQ